jgi:two-component system, chemotaxis family, protein-glutamate methylesterase/glutaminase
MIKVLVIDDSAVMRAFLGRVVGSQPDMELAGVVPDPLLAIERVRRASPDVITLDVEMPGMNGLDFLRNLMAVRPLPVIMISSLTREGADTTLRALELGAVDFFPKPDSFSQLDELALDIAEKIRAAAQAKVVRRKPVAPPERVFQRVARPRAAATGQVIGIGASTGGVEALRSLLTELPPTMPPILIAQHMLPGFTETFARRLDAICALQVKQAEDGEEACEGCVYVAPGGRHLKIERRVARYVLRVTDDAPVNRHRPSVDTLFHSMAQAVGAQGIALMLTGMGGDGAEAMLAMRRSGARTIAQDEATSVVFGMPRQAIAVGAACEVLPLPQIGKRLKELAGVAEAAADDAALGARPGPMGRTAPGLE